MAMVSLELALMLMMQLPPAWKVMMNMAYPVALPVVLVTDRSTVSDNSDFSYPNFSSNLPSFLSLCCAR